MISIRLIGQQFNLKSMNSLSTFILKAIRKIYAKTFGGYQLPPLQREEDPDKASEMIYNLLSDDKPCMIARFGSTEMSAIINYLGVNSPQHSIWKFIQGKQPEWWWNKNIMNQMQQWSGFFPPTPENMQRFGEMMIEDAKEVDLLGSWLKEENRILSLNESLPQMIRFIYLEPFWSTLPWTRVLMNKKVLVIHPFADLITIQYNNNRKYLFKNPNILPEFELQTIKAVQSLGGLNNEYNDWFEALEYMKQEITQYDFDICLIGCGAYGFPLAAHVKRMGKKAVHLGGSLQLLFGIIGKRWENPKQGSKELKGNNKYPQLFNKYWARPSMYDTPANKNNIEGGCYW